LNSCKILDPAIGEGELIVALVEKILEINPSCDIEIKGYETDCRAIESTLERVDEKWPAVSIEIEDNDFLSVMNDENAEKGAYDIIIANPPYIRTQILGADKSRQIAQKLNLSGRVDIYYAFMLYALDLLSPCGVAGFITSNKFMTIKAGKTVRQKLYADSKIRLITDFGDTKLFNASVLPCIIVFSKGRTKPRDVEYTSIYESIEDNHSGEPANSIFEQINVSTAATLKDGRSFSIKHGNLNANALGEPWSMASLETDKWIKAVESSTWRSFSDIGKIRVGIKTTADNVFIGNSWPIGDMRPELLLPLITHRNAGQIASQNSDMWEVLYTHKSVNGRICAVDLNLYPISRRYLLEYKNQLESRVYLKKAGRHWFEIWVPQNPESWAKRKIVFRDISEHPQFWLDESGAVVNGDCYWIELNDDVDEDVVYLALAVANSPFIEKYYDAKYNNKLYSGKRRYQSQYVENFPLPPFSSHNSKIAINLARQITANHKDYDVMMELKNELDSVIERIFIAR
jgi:hypothetical protein